MVYSFPGGMRIATLEEREKFYKIEYNHKKAMKWIGKRSLLFAIKTGMHTQIYKKELEKEKNKVLILIGVGKKELKRELKYYLPESVYYDRTVYKDLALCEKKNLTNIKEWDNVLGQELCFDMDPENINCGNCGSLLNRLKRKSTLSFCSNCFNSIQYNTIKLYDLLKEDFKNIKTVFSGRGFHLHILDKKAYKMSFEERKELSVSLLKKGIHHDEWVSEGTSRLIRLPYSLNGLVNRIVTPIRIEKILEINLETDFKPEYLKQENS